MVAKINHGSSLYGALAYNQQKVDEGKGRILECNLVMTPADGHFNVYDVVDDFGRFTPSHSRTAKPIVHISLNPHPDDKLTDAQLADLGREYLERLGYGGQPWMIFKHEDIDREHIHIVTTRVRPDGSLVPDRFEHDRSNRIVQQLEAEFNLIPAKGRSQGEAWQIAPVDAAAGDLKRQVGNVIKPLSEMYRFRSLSEYRALLSLYNIGVEKIEGDNKGHRYAGLVYSVLDADGNRVGKPLKSSLFGKKYGVEALERVMAKSAEVIKTDGTAAKTKGIVSAALTSARDGSELPPSRDAFPADGDGRRSVGELFRAALRGKGIDLILRYNDGGRLYGVTFIDHNSRTVLNGSALGKEFSANALSARFADFSTASREDTQTSVPSLSVLTEQTQGASIPSTVENVSISPIAIEAQDTPVSTPTATDEAVRPTMTGGAPHLTTRPTPDDRSSATRTTTPDLSTVGDAAGSLFSILTPDAGGQNDNPSGPKRRKKKKRRYGQQQ